MSPCSFICRSMFLISIISRDIFLQTIYTRVYIYTYIYSRYIIYCFVCNVCHQYVREMNIHLTGWYNYTWSQCTAPIYIYIHTYHSLARVMYNRTPIIFFFSCECFFLFSSLLFFFFFVVIFCLPSSSERLP